VSQPSYPTEQVFVIDTCSVTWIRWGQQFKPAARATLLSALAARISADVLVYPPEVVAELGKSKYPSDLHAWARGSQPQACRFGSCREEARQVLAVAPDVLDAAKTTGTEEADPYLIATALHLRNNGVDARVVSDDFVDKLPMKRSVATACGMLGIPRIPMHAYLQMHGLWAPAPGGPSIPQREPA
jgi:hypothetical protein